MRSKVKVGGYYDGPVPWPTKWNTRSLILRGALVEAVKVESAVAVAHHWGVSTATVKKWRGALEIEAYYSIQIRRHLLGVPNPAPLRAAWSPEEDALLRRLTEDELRKRTGRSLSSFLHRRAALGLKNPNPKRRTWLPKEVAMLGKISDHKIARLLDCPVHNVKAKRCRLGIRAPEAYG